MLSPLVGEELLRLDVSEVKRNDELDDSSLELWRSLEAGAVVLELGDSVEESVLVVGSMLVEEAEAESAELEEYTTDVLEEGSVVGFEELVEEARSVELEISIEEAVLEGSVLVGPIELVEESGSIEFEVIKDTLEEGSVLVGLGESAEAVLERLGDDDESKGVLATLEIEESELIAEIVLLVETSVGGFDALAVALEVLVLDILSVIDEMEVTAGELDEILAVDGVPLSMEFEIVEDVEMMLEVKVREDVLGLSGDVEAGLEEVLKRLVVIED